MNTETTATETAATDAPKVTKKDRVLSYLADNPEASAADVQAHFEANDYGTISTNYISMCKGGSGKSRSVNVSTAIEQLIKVKELVAELGGADAVREAIETAAKFTECVGAGNEIESLKQLEQLS